MSVLIAVWSRIVLSQDAPISGVAISFSIAAASLGFLLVALMEKLAPTASVLHWLQAPPSIAGMLMMPSGKFSGSPPLSAGTKARAVYQLPIGNISPPGLVWK